MGIISKQVWLYYILTSIGCVCWYNGIKTFWIMITTLFVIDVLIIFLGCFKCKHTQTLFNIYFVHLCVFVMLHYYLTDIIRAYGICIWAVSFGLLLYHNYKNPKGVLQEDKKYEESIRQLKYGCFGSSILCIYVGSFVLVSNDIYLIGTDSILFWSAVMLISYGGIKVGITLNLHHIRIKQKRVHIITQSTLLASLGIIQQICRRL